MPGSLSSDELLPAHLLASAETAQGISFRKQLAYRESARKAFFAADNDLALRKAFLLYPRRMGNGLEGRKRGISGKLDRTYESSCSRECTCDMDNHGKQVV